MNASTIRSKNQVPERRHLFTGDFGIVTHEQKAELNKLFKKFPNTMQRHLASRQQLFIPCLFQVERAKFLFLKTLHIVS